ncbi:MAG: sigma-54 dependent transcriptional regulator [Thermodesulfobacteriota bacterium]
METILVVDDEKNYLLVMAALLSEEGYEVLTAESGPEALESLNDGVDLILTDMTMPRMDGIELLTRVKEARPELPVIMMTAYGTVEKAVEAMKKGAFDYITKPFQNEDLKRDIRKALEMGRVMKRNQELSQALQERYSFGNIIGKSKPMLDIYRLIEKVADTRANVLITGDSGTGKELIAKAIHYNGPRGQGPFIAVNCSALAETLLESELFGHEKGAFTDARASRKGRFELAHGGSLFLDEVGEMSPNLQAKLLRVIQDRKFERVGGVETIQVDVRVIAATNRELKREVAAGRFREDLFYRLNVVHLHVPPLRERPDDLPLLVAHFIRKFGGESRLDRKIKISPEAFRLLYSYHWPGNVRELENALERAVILCSGDTILPEDLPEELQEIKTEGDAERPPRELDEALLADLMPRGLDLNATLEAVERKLIAQALSRTNNIQAHAAELLGIKKNVMQYKMKKYGFL